MNVDLGSKSCNVIYINKFQNIHAWNLLNSACEFPDFKLFLYAIKLT